MSIVAMFYGVAVAAIALVGLASMAALAQESDVFAIKAKWVILAVERPFVVEVDFANNRLSADTTDPLAFLNDSGSESLMIGIVAASSRARAGIGASDFMALSRKWQGVLMEHGCSGRCGFGR
jgi:hypothetical protein